MLFNPGEPEMYEHAQNTRFASLVDDIATDPTGRGRVPAMSPLMSRAGSSVFDPEEGLTPAQRDEFRAKEAAGDRKLQELGVAEGRDPQADFTLAEVENRRKNMGMSGGGSPTALLSGGKSFDRTPPASAAASPPAWEQGDNEAIAGLEFPPDRAAPSAAPVELPANKPDYGRVTAEQIKPGSAGDAPPGGDKWLAGLRGVGSILMSGGGRADMGMKAGLDAYGDYQDQERELRDFNARQAELDATAAKEQRGENRYVSETNYGRERDENTDARAIEDRQWQRGFADRGAAERAAELAYDRDPARRQEELDQYRGKKQIDREFAPKRGTGAGRAGQAERDMAYRSMMDSAKELYPDGVPQNVANEIAMRAMDKDPIKASASFIDGLRGESTASSKFETTRADKQNAATVKAEAAKAEASGALNELQALRADILAEKSEGQNYIPGKEPTAQNVVAGIPRVISRNVASVGGRGSSGFTPRQQRIQSGGKLVGRGKYLRNQGNSANLKAESDLADADILADGTLDGMLQRIDSEIQALGGAIDSGQIVPRDANGNRLDLTEQPQRGATFTNPEEM